MTIVTTYGVLFPQFVAASSLHVRPTPQLPSKVDISLVGDIFSYSFGRQIHCTLFDQGITTIPKPYLIKSYSVSRDQLEYRFMLHPNLVLHDLSPLTSLTVKTSLEHSIKNKAVNFDTFNNIIGFKDFTNKKSNGLKGIVTIDPLKFAIRLSRPDINLIYKLTDIRFSIRSLTKSHVGCGSYKIENQDNKTVSKLALFLHNEEIINPGLVNMAPKSVIYEKASYSQAIEGFKTGHFNDLALYVPSESDLPALTNLSNHSQVNFPRTYLLGLNPKALNLVQRKFIFSKINRISLIQRCYKDQSITHSLVPPGFLGYNEDRNLFSFPESTESQMKRIKGKILILEGVGSENCVLQELNKTLSSLGISIEIAPIAEYIKHWTIGNIAGVFAYIEGETSFHYFGSFNPTVDLSWGDPRDEKFDSLLTLFLNAADSGAQSSAAKVLSSHLLSQATTLPLFHQKGLYLYSKKYQSLGKIFASPALTPISLFREVPKQ